MRQDAWVGRAAVRLAGALVLGGGSLLAQGGGATMPDAQIEVNVLKALASAPQLATENITTNTVYGVVTLTGNVKDEANRTTAENLAARAGGVKKVVDELGIGAVAAVSAPPAATPANQTPSDSADATNPLLQSDGTMAPSAGQPQHAPDPDVYAAQHGLDTSSSAGDDSGGSPSAAPVYRQPYTGTGTQQAPGAAAPQGGQANPQDVRPPYRAGGMQRGGPQRMQDAPPPYGAQVAGKPVTIPSGSLLRVRINEGLDSKHTQPGAVFDAVMLNDVVADNAVAIPRGAAVQGVVTAAKSGGAIKGHGELSLQLTHVTLGGQVYPIVSDIWQRDSSDKGAQTVGNAVGLGAAGALIGALAGGGGGALLGAGLGGAAGVGTSASSGGRQVVIPSEAILTFHMAQPAPVTTISQAEMDRLSNGVPTGAQPGQQMVRRRYPQPYYGPPGYPPPPPPDAQPY